MPVFHIDELMRLRVAGMIDRVIYRVQDLFGRGPWRPGLSHRWVESRPDHDNLEPWHVAFGPDAVASHAKRGMHYGCGCATLDQLRRWFSLSEYTTLRLLGFRAVAMDVDRILHENDIQLMFERSIPLRHSVFAVSLYDFER